MEDYPRTLQELESLFASEEACRDYLARLRWPHGFVCPTCEGTQAWCTGRGLWMCGSCGHQTSVTAGTLFQDTRTSLVTWFRPVWWVVSQKNGASALGLQRVLGLGSYRTAWTWLHTFRFNRRASRHRGKLFYRLLQQAVTLDPVPYRANRPRRARPEEGAPPQQVAVT